MNSDINLRLATLSDAPQLVKIYAPYVKKTVITFEYQVPSVSEFRQRMANTMTNYPYLVAERDGQIVGYAYVGHFVGREAYDWAVETSIYVDTKARHGGIGGKLYDALERICQLMGITNMNACIGYPRNGKDDPYLTKNSQQFHQHLGYQLVGEFHDCGYKFGRWYDMIWMEKMIGDHPDKAHPVKNFNDIKDEVARQLKIK